MKMIKHFTYFFRRFTSFFSLSSRQPPTETAPVKVRNKMALPSVPFGGSRIIIPEIFSRFIMLIA